MAKDEREYYKSISRADKRETKKAGLIMIFFAIGLLCGLYLKEMDIKANYVPIADFYSATVNEDDYLTFELKDYGNVNDDENMPSYEGIAERINRR